MATSAPIWYGADQFQFVIPYPATNPNSPIVVMAGAAGLASGPAPLPVQLTTTTTLTHGSSSGSTLATTGTVTVNNTALYPGAQLVVTDGSGNTQVFILSTQANLSGGAGSQSFSINPVTVTLSGSGNGYSVASISTTDTLAQLQGSNAATLQNAGYAVFMVSYRGSSNPSSGDGYPVVGSVPAWPVEIDDLAAGTYWVLSNAHEYNGSPNNLHILGGSASGALAGLLTPKLLSQGVNVLSCQLLSSNADWWSAMAYYIANPGSNSDSHMGNIANAYGTFSDTGSGAGAPLTGSLQWHLNGALGQKLQTNGSPVYPTGADIWTQSFFAGASVAQQVSLAPSTCWWNLFNSATEEIPLQQPYVLSEALINSGSMAALTILPGSVHGYNYFTTVQNSIISFIEQASSH